MVEKAKNTGEATLVFLRVAQEVYGNPPAQNDAAEAQTPQAAQVVEQGQVLTFVVEFSLTRPVSGLEYSIQIYELGGRLAFATTNTELGTPLGALQAGTHEVRCLVAAALPEGGYTASFAFAELANAGSDAGAVHLAALEDACSFRVQLPPERHAQGYMQLPSSLLHQQKNTDVILTSQLDLNLSINNKFNNFVWEMSAQCIDFELKGFSSCETWGRWIDGGAASIKFRGKFFPLLMKFNIRSFTPDSKSEVTCDIYIKDKLLDTWVESRDEKAKTKILILEKNDAENFNELTLNFLVKGGCAPKEFIKESDDSRILGIGIEKIEISEVNRREVIKSLNDIRNEVIDFVVDKKIENLLNDLSPEIRLSIFREANPSLISKDYIFWQNRYKDIVFKLKDKINNKQKIKVAFLVNMFSSFSAAGVFREMLEDEMFDPLIIVAPFVPFGDKKEQAKKLSAELNIGRLLYKKVHPALNSSEEIIDYREDIDIIFMPSGAIYNQRSPYQVFDFLEKSILIVFIDYTFLVQKAGNHENSIFSNLVWRNYVQTDFHLNEFKTKQDIKGSNARLSGYPKMDLLFLAKIENARSRKKIIIAPHHSMHGIGLSGQFLKYADFYIKLLKKYPEVDFVFRPHPLFYRAIKSYWNERKISAYWDEIKSHSNGFYDENPDYFELFSNSDGLINDCGSFLPEYIFTGNSQCYLLDKKNDLSNYFNDLGLSCLNYCYKAFNEVDIENYVRDTILSENDPMKETRLKFLKDKLSINYPNSSKWIVSDIKESIVNFESIFPIE